jgi:hypothetical protein
VSRKPQQSARSSHDVFVSYRRTDLLFVRQLCEHIQQGGLTPWVDVEGLFAGEEFWPEIRKAIDAAAAFVFVITAESVASAVCLRELAHAVGSHKRLVPVCRKDVDSQSLPPELASRQWVLFREGDDPEAAVVALLNAIREDWNWARRQAQLQSRANDWEARGDDRSLTLRGRELVDADTWLAESTGEHRVPTALQRRFIATSRVAAWRRRRNLTLSVVITTVVLAIVGWNALANAISRKSSISQQYLGRGNADAAIEQAVSARELCRYIPFNTQGCLDAVVHLGHAYFAKSDFEQAGAQFSVVINEHGRADEWSQNRLAIAYHQRANTYIQLAERATDERSRAANYAQAGRDLGEAERIRQRVSGPPGTSPLGLTVARVHLGNAEPDKAVDALEGTATDDPEKTMLLAAAQYCLGDAVKTEALMSEYMTRILASGKYETWRRKQQYFQEVSQQCRNSRMPR